MKRISDKKLEAFAVGNINIKRQLSRKEIEEQKKKEDEAAAAHAFKEFVETFQDSPSGSSKVWVKAGTYHGPKREDTHDKGKLYKPTSKLEDKSAAEKAQEYAKMLASDLKKDALPVKKKSQEKKKSNLELFKEELRQIQEEREERHKYKGIAGQVVVQQSTVEHPTETRESGSFDTGDPNTTNLYLGNLNPKISEQQLMEIFGRYGPLASIKIMWPRSEEEKQRGRNCGFVAYMSRKDAERALRVLNGRYVMSYEMRLGWGKAVPIMNQPIFIPPSMLELTMPPPPSGLPFNAQPPPSEAQSLPNKNYKDYTDDEEKENMERVLYKSVVKVFIPTEKSVLNIIHRMIEFVIREGPMFEALIMSRESDNPLFSFLFDNESPAHIYYRWKLFSLLQGDTPSEWCEKDFRMFKGGPIWRPPVANFYTQGMAEDLVVDPDAPEVHKGALSTAQRDRLEDLIRHLTPERTRIGDSMVFCIEHADAADEICECIAESLANPNTLASKKIARLYLISDILHNCTVKVSNASFFRKSIERHLLDVFENMHIFCDSFESRLKAENIKSRVLNIIRTWEEWTIYPKEFLSRLRSIFLGRQMIDEGHKQGGRDGHDEHNNNNNEHNDDDDNDDDDEDEEDIDGAPMSGEEKDDEDLDGVPLDGAALLKGALMRSLPDSVQQKGTPTRHRSQEASRDIEYNDDIDGVPLDDDIDGVPIDKFEGGKSGLKGGAFIPSKWETVDPEQVEAQAITTSKWDTLDPPQAPKFFDSNSSDDDNDDEANSHGSYKETERNKLREIEVRTMQYQDDLEAGRREIKAGWTLHEQVEYYRKKLMRKEPPKETPLESPLTYAHNTTTSRDSPGRRAPPSPPMRNSAHKRTRSRSPYTRRESPTARRSSRRPPAPAPPRSRSPSESPKRSYVTTPSRSRRSPSPSYSSRHRAEKHKHKHRH